MEVMKEKTLSFLKSLHIDNVDDFDMCFSSVARNPNRREEIDMVLIKDTPWRYDLLNQLQEGLNRVSYPYRIRFIYMKKVTGEDAYNLFFNWYQNIHHIPSKLDLSYENKTLRFNYKSSEEKKQYEYAISDFKDFLTFINYEINIEEEIVSTQKKIETPKETPQQNEIEAGSIKKEPESIKEPEVNKDEIKEVIDKEKEILIEVAEDSYLEIAKQNLEDRKQEIERQRLTKRGNYKIIEKIDDITDKSDHVDFVGRVFSLEEREFSGKKKYTIGIFDNNGEGAIYVEQISNASFSDEFASKLKKWGTNVRVRGVAYYNQFSKALSIKGHYIDLLPAEEIIPDIGETRVELHLHSNMSSMDGISSMDDYCAYAKALGHKAIALTDHAVVQAYPDAQGAAKKNRLKLIYGVEFNMIEDKQTYIFNPSNVELNKATYVVLDTETTGLSAKYNRIIEFGAVKVEHGSVVDRLDVLINPQVNLPKKIVELTNISDDMLVDKPTIKEVFPKILSFIGDAVLVTHNAQFDVAMLNAELKRNGFETLKNPIIDTLALSRYLFPDSKRHNLGSLCRNMQVTYDEDDAHRADYDAQVLNDVWQPMLAQLTKGKLSLTHEELAKLDTPVELYKHIKPSHVIALAKNQNGVKALYKLVSQSHTDYLSDGEVPKITRSKIEEFRKDLILGSACLNGDVFNAARYYEEDVLLNTMNFYDYIEVQPIENYSFLEGMRDNTHEEIINLIHDIINGAEKINKPVCATGDVHYVTKDKKIFRDVYIFAKGLGGVNHPLNPYGRVHERPFENPDQHYRSTKEMLECFSFLGEDKAKEIVITNTNKIADSIEECLALPKGDSFRPKIDNCENMLRDICYKKAHELYGEELPELISQRLEKELGMIIKNEYSVIYYIAHKIVGKANEDGYVVGSRGSVGSSFVATMASITEVNPLPPHYLCPKCHHFELTSSTMPQYKSGYDLPEKVCPICGEKMMHDGQNIPFETFLGFHGDKVPDIDLNFPNDYQSKAHDYTKVLLGEKNVFRAGTIETVAEKTAFGYAKGFIERKLRNQGVSDQEITDILNNYNKAKIAFLASGCIGVKRTTGQHPGGIVVIPKENEVFDFTPYQYPADDVESNWYTTHFDFNSMHDIVLKLDLLGHVDPLALRMMCELTGVDIKSIPMNDPKIVSLFSSPDALGMSEDYDKSSTGALGLPEFGTNFVRGILEMTRPKSFADLVIISGISHGTNVWQGNADQLIKDGTATLQEVIGCRDDIMTYLIDKGLPPETSFQIMEKVRKGKGLTEEQEAIMRANNVPDYYINSCKLIKYMFPKGHAVAYVTMAMRVAYFKLYHPLVYYAVFFSTRSKQYDIEVMIKGKKAIIDRLIELDAKSKIKTEKLTTKEEEQQKTLHMALEMVQRGFKFTNIDLYKSDSVNFVVDEENKALIPPFTTVDNLGENNAQTVIEARKDGEFTSKENLLRRTKLTSTNVDSLSKMGVLDYLSEDDQLTLF